MTQEKVMLVLIISLLITVYSVFEKKWKWMTVGMFGMFISATYLILELLERF